MKKVWCVVLSALLISCVAGVNAWAAEKVLYGFEKGSEGWEIPEWALEKEDHVAKSVEASKDVAKEGKSSLKVMTVFPGKIWAASMVEVAEYFDWSTYKEVSCDIYLPANAQEGLKAKMILTIGDDWAFVEMSRSEKLVPGQWTTIKASLADGSMDFRKIVADKAFRSDIRKLAVRVESNKKPEYTGPIYIDNVKVTE